MPLASSWRWGEAPEWTQAKREACDSGERSDTQLQAREALNKSPTGPFSLSGEPQFGDLFRASLEVTTVTFDIYVYSLVHTDSNLYQ